MRHIPLAACALAWSVSALAQVSVQESATRAQLVEGKTTVSLALKNSSSNPLDVYIALQWLGPTDEVHGFERRTLSLPTGDSSIPIALPLSAKYDPLLDRLRYDVYPGVKNYTTFTPFKGILNFVNIADYAFALGVVTADLPRPGKPYEVRVLTFHPATGQPVAGVNVKSGDSGALSDRNGVALLRVQPDLDEERPEFKITAQLGDFRQNGQTTPLVLIKGDIGIYTDKPLYQPGQTMHLRILAKGGNGLVRANAEHEIRIVGENEDLAYAATVTTSRFGIAWTDWEIPANAKSGEYKIEARSDEFEYSFSRMVSIRRYELPSFRVTAKPDHPYYLPGQKAVIEIGADYLFGKPVTSGQVRITEGDEQQVVLKGNLDAAGRFRGSIDASTEPAGDSRFVDRHFTAFLTDASTNRTEQHKFDLRVSRDPLHVYVAGARYIGAGRRLYITTYAPDGAPALSDIEIVSGTNVLGKGKTNRFGLARIDIPNETGSDELAVRATTADGRHAREESAHFYESRPELWLETEQSLYRPGDAVHCRIGSGRKDLPVLLMAWNETGGTVFSKNLRLRDGHAEVEIPYDKRFGRRLSVGVASGAERSTAARVVIFPGPDDLALRAIPAKGTYRPGETASIQFQASAETALGIAVIDQSVLDRVATDKAFGRRRWFDLESTRELNLGGFTERDLLNMDPAKIDDALQLVAELLLQDPPLINSADDFAGELEAKFAKVGERALEPVRRALDDHYIRTLQYPRDEAALFTMANSTYLAAQDPWMRPYYARFTTEGAEDVTSFMSAGPDKQVGTDDDFCALKVKRRWFANFEALIDGRLRALADYPATKEAFIRLLEEGGIRFDALRDPWGSAMRIEIEHIRDRREVRVVSAGPDRSFGTRDDVRVVTFAGAYFATMGGKIEQAITAATQFPSTPEQFRAALQPSGVDFDSLRDPWGRNYYLAFHTEETFTDRLDLYSYAEYNGVQENRKQITPVKRTVLIVEIRSVGDDGVKGTYDDFAVASFSRVLDTRRNRPEEVEKIAPPAFSIGGTGTIAGVVMDASGAVVASVQVTLNGGYATRTDANGRYFFRGIAPGMYRLKFESAGFRASVIERAPVKADHLTRADTVLQVGAVSEMVTVQASVPVLNTEMASVAFVAPGVAAVTAVSTPRVREYFPETLYWQPELITDASGRASINVKLADSITTWRVAVIGSTLDGRIAEASADIRAFQPFLVELDVPPVLTTGDEIALPVPVRNYLERTQNVAVSAMAPESLRLLQAVRQPGLIAPSSSGNAVLELRAVKAVSGARLRVTALAGAASDAIEKPVTIHPDGERKETTVSGVAENGRLLRVDVPSTAIPGSIRAEVKFYPSLLARVLESMESLLERPYGCGEQTISSTYPNLLFLKALKDAGIKEEKLESRAMKNLRTGYQRLLGYQDEGGGFTYWGRGDPDVALTAYALSFLRDAKEFVEVDEDRIAKAQTWLGQQKATESAAHALQVRALVQAGPKYAVDLDRKLGEMARRAAEFDHPYAIATFALAAMDAAKPELARPAIERLCAMSQDEQGAAYWSLKANTPFYGWGRSGQVETTALVVSALAKWRRAGNSDPAIVALIDRGALFLLKNASASGGWATSQSTVRALIALLDTWTKDDGSKSSVFDVSVNGMSGGKVVIPAGRTVRGPVTLDLSRVVKPGITNEVAVAGTNLHAVEAQLNTTWYETWSKGSPGRTLALETRYSAVTAAINQPVTCEVLVSRPAFRGYGMMIAEIGLPPGVEVDRGTLANIVDDPKSGVDSFEVAPDHVTFYVWPRAADSRFRFSFRPRFAMKARMAQSVLYDYYNPDERVTLAPEVFTVGK